MKTTRFAFILSIVTIFLFTSLSFAGKRSKFGEDPRHKEAKRVTFKTSTEKIR